MRSVDSQLVGQQEQRQHAAEDALNGMAVPFGPGAGRPAWRQLVMARRYAILIAGAGFPSMEWTKNSPTLLQLT